MTSKRQDVTPILCDPNSLQFFVATSYLINHENLRVKKSNAGETRHFVYDDAGHMLGEYDGSGAAVQELVWLGDTPVAVMGTMPCLTGSSCTESGVAYVWADHLNTPREITRVNGSNQHVSIWKWDSLPFGETTPNANPSNLGVMTFNHRFPGQYKDSETGLHQNWNREYDPRLGRYVQPDPIGMAGGLQLYRYGSNSPAIEIDPLGLCTLVASGGASNSGTIDLYDDNGDRVNGWNYTSGVMGNTNQNSPSSGPIPSGRFTLNVGQITEGGLLRQLTGDWGRFRVPLTPDPGNPTTRSGFYLHGGKQPGSAGCIDVGTSDDLFTALKAVCSGNVPVIIK